MYKETFKTFSKDVSDVKIPWNAKSRRYFHFKLQQGNKETRVISRCPGKLEKIKQKERNRLPAHVTNVGMPMAKNIEWTSCLEYPLRRISSSTAALSFTGFKVNMTDSSCSIKSPQCTDKYSKKMFDSEFWRTKNVKFHWLPVGCKTTWPKPGDWEWLWRHFRSWSFYPK